MTEAMARQGADRIVVRPSGPLEGSVPIGGAKNSVLKLMAATSLAPGTYGLTNVPGIADVECMGDLLRAMGMNVEHGPSELTITNPGNLTPEAPYELVERMRASIVVLGPLLGAYGEARVALPGGDDLGPRPIDMHMRGLDALGATFTSAHGYIEARAEQLTGTRVLLEFPSVGATENVMMAAVRAKGTTVIDNAAREPEIADLAAFLTRMGAMIMGAGSPTITIEGVGELHPVAEYAVVPDRIEAMTYLAAVGSAGGEIILAGARPDHLDLACQKLGEMGMRTSPDPAGLWARSDGRLRATDIATLPYPGLATDFKPLLVALLSVADGVGIVTENLFSGRWRYVDELIRMGANIRTEGHHAVVRGQARLSGAPVRAHDIRAGAALVVAGLSAEGETEIHDPFHIDRGYDDLVGKMCAIGADVERVTL